MCFLVHIGKENTGLLTLKQEYKDGNCKTKHSTRNIKMPTPK
jgi:hypothetical protein